MVSRFNCMIILSDFVTSWSYAQCFRLSMRSCDYSKQFILDSYLRSRRNSCLPLRRDTSRELIVRRSSGDLSGPDLGWQQLCPTFTVQFASSKLLSSTLSICLPLDWTGSATKPLERTVEEGFFVWKKSSESERERPGESYNTWGANVCVMASTNHNQQ